MADVNAETCVALDKGSVGEPGAALSLVHQHTEGGQKVAVLRNTGSSLCANTGAVAILVVNGQPVAQGDLTAVDSSIQARIGPNDAVAAIVHTVPLFNGINCVRLGELSVVLEECDARY